MWLPSFLATSLVVLSGVLAPADPGVLEGAQARRVRNGWGLAAEAGPGTVLIAIDDCTLIGAGGWVVVDGEARRAAVVDCTNREHATLESLGLVADVNVSELGHREAIVILMRDN